MSEYLIMNQIEVNSSTSILVVDDNPKNLQVLGGLLKKKELMLNLH